MSFWVGLLYFIFGAVFGSFACCQAHRLHLKEQGKKLQNSRSVCLHCHYQLRWFDNIPVLSWLILRGKCRKCGRFIGWAELFSELSLGATFAALGWQIFPPTPALIVLLVALVALWVLLIYDAKWHRLPTKLLYLAIICGLTHLIFKFTPPASSFILNTLGGIGILAGLYYLLYFFSHEKAVGSGDWLLALALALFLGHWWLALITLFLANALACLASLPALIRRQKKHQIPLGPFLIIAFVLVYLLQDWLLALALPL